MIAGRPRQATTSKQEPIKKEQKNRTKEQTKNNTRNPVTLNQDNVMQNHNNSKNQNVKYKTPERRFW